MSMMAAGERRRAVDAVGSRRPYRQRQRVVSSPMVRPIAQYLRPIENMFFFFSCAFAAYVLDIFCVHQITRPSRVTR